MGIAVSKLWGNNKFKSLTNNSKLLYLYLATNPSINLVGVVSNEPEDVAKSLSLSIEQVRDSTKELIDVGYIYVVKSEGSIYWIVPSHFSTVGNSDSMVEKIKSDIKSIPDKVQEFLSSIGISGNNKRKKFQKPTPKEAQDFGFSLGYYVNGEEFINFYDNNPKSNEDFWYDGRGKIVSDWKGKMRKVWCRDKNKVVIPTGAPAGLEYLHIITDKGIVFPDGWRDGKPFSKDFLLSKKFQSEYEKWKQ